MVWFSRAHLWSPTMKWKTGGTGVCCLQKFTSRMLGCIGYMYGNIMQDLHHGGKSVRKQNMNQYTWSITLQEQLHLHSVSNSCVCLEPCRFTVFFGYCWKLVFVSNRLRGSGIAQLWSMIGKLLFSEVCASKTQKMLGWITRAERWIKGISWHPVDLGSLLYIGGHTTHLHRDYNNIIVSRCKHPYEPTSILAWRKGFERSSCEIILLQLSNKIPGWRVILTFGVCEPVHFRVAESEFLDFPSKKELHAHYIHYRLFITYICTYI